MVNRSQRILIESTVDEFMNKLRRDIEIHDYTQYAIKMFHALEPEEKRNKRLKLTWGNPGA